MPFPAQFLRLQVEGQGVLQERWSWSLSIVPNFEGPGTITAPTSVPTAIANAVQTFHTSAPISSTAKLERVKLNLLDVQGRYVSQTTTVEHQYPTPIAGGTTFPAYPFLTAAVTLRTPRRRGPGSNGRFYPPYIAIDRPNTDGRWTVAQIQGLADAAATMINAINAATDGVVGVASEVGTGTFQPCTAVEVGRVADVQRRRKNKLLEEHVPAAVTVVP